MTEDFYRIKRLPPYVIAEVNAMQAAARAARRGHHRSRHGQSRPAAAAACDRQAVRGRAQARRAWLFGLEGHPRAAQGAGQLLCAPLRRRSRSRDARSSSRWARRKASPISPRRSPRRATSCWRRTRAIRSTPSASSSPARRSARCRPRPTSAIWEALERAMAFTVPRPSVLVIGYPVEPDRRGGRPRLLRAARRLGEGAQALGALRPRLFRALLRRHARRPRSCRCRARRTSRSSSPRCRKTYSMAGWRIGFAVGNRELIAALTRVKSYLDYGAFTPIQAAAVRRAQRPAGHRREEPRALPASAATCWSRASAAPAGTSRRRAASMFAWAPLPPALTHLGSLEFSKQLLTHAEVAVAPGVGYGEDGEGFVRIAHGRERAAPAPGGAQREALPAEHGRQHARAHRLGRDPPGLTAPRAPPSARMTRPGFAFSTRFRVRYAEIDGQKVVFNSRYLEYADVAVTEFWEWTGIEDSFGRGMDRDRVPCPPCRDRLSQALRARRYDRGPCRSRGLGPRASLSASSSAMRRPARFIP